MQTVNLLTISGNWESKNQTFITVYCLSNIITYKEIFKKNLIFSLKPGLKPSSDG